MKKVAIWLIAVLFVPLGAHAASYAEGKNYAHIVPEQPTESEGKVEVVELFWYGCPHCYRFQPYMERWLKKKPDDVAYRRLPAILGEHWAIHARAYFTAEALGVTEKIHAPLFDAMHAQKRRLDTEDELARFFAEHGVKAEDFHKTFRSFTVDAKVKRARDLTTRYRTQATPSVVVNGKYIFEPERAGSLSEMIKVMEFLIEKERGAGS